MMSAEPLKYSHAASEANATFSKGIGVSLLPPIDASPGERPTIAIMSFGEMGMGIAALLTKYSYPVVTNLDGRSPKTRARATAIGVQDLPFAQMLEVASLFFSILPPAESLSLAKSTAATVQTSRRSKDKLLYLDLNAISPDLSREISDIITGAGMTFIDGAILGFPPRELSDKTWFRPAVPTSGPDLAALKAPWTRDLVSLLNIRHVGDQIGGASGLKMCFSAIYKGHAAVVTQAYTTAENLGVLPALRTHLVEYFPTTTPIMENSLVGSQRKAYRWIKEMQEIEETFAKDGGWGRELFTGVADVFRLVAYETDLEKDTKTDIKDITKEICRCLRQTD